MNAVARESVVVAAVVAAAWITWVPASMAAAVYSAIGVAGGVAMMWVAWRSRNKVRRPCWEM